MLRNRLTIPVVGGVSLLSAVLYYRSIPRKSREQQIHERRMARQEQGIMGVGSGNTHAIGGFELGQPGSGHDSPSEDPARKVETTAPREKLPQGGVGGGEASPRDINFPGLDKGQIGRDEGGVMASFSRNTEYEKDVGGGEKGGEEARGTEGGEGEGGEKERKGEDGGEGEMRREGQAGQDKGEDGGRDSRRGGKGGGKKDNSQSSSEKSPSKYNGPSETLQGLFGQGGRTSQDKDYSNRFHDTKILSHMEDTPTRRGPDKRYPDKRVR